MNLRSRCCVAVAALAVTASCGHAGDASVAPTVDDGVRVAGFDFAESELLAEVYAQALEARDVPVVRLGTVGPREIVAPALERGLADLVPEYLGTALEHAGATERLSDREAAVEELNRLLARRGLTALAPSPAEDKNVFVVRAELAGERGIATLSDLSPHAGGLRFGGPPECTDRPLCLAGLEEVYGLRFSEFVTQPSLRFTAEALRRNEIDVGVMFSTDAALIADDLVVLDDDLRMQPAENVLPVVRDEALDRWGARVVAALDAVSSALTTTELRELNRRVGEGRTVEEVASQWLAEQQLLGAD